jgi:hypothetical protein
VLTASIEELVGAQTSKAGFSIFVTANNVVGPLINDVHCNVESLRESYRAPMGNQKSSLPRNGTYSLRGFLRADIARSARATMSLPSYPHFVAQTLQTGFRSILSPIVDYNNLIISKGF